jgi:hypothetical protein
MGYSQVLSGETSASSPSHGMLGMQALSTQTSGLLRREQGALAWPAVLSIWPRHGGLGWVLLWGEVSGLGPGMTAGGKHTERDWALSFSS